MKRYPLIAVALFVIAVITKAPASLVLLALPETVRIEAGCLKGSLWKGSGHDVLVQVQGRDWVVDTLAWRLSPISLLMLQPLVDVQVKAPKQRAAGQLVWLGKANWRIKNGAFELPADLIGRTVLGSGSQYRFAGQISLQAPVLEIAQGDIQVLQGRAGWQSARWFDGQLWYDLGNFAADLQSGDDGGIHAQLFDLNGPVGVVGNATLKRFKTLRFNGNIALRERAPAPLKEILPVLGERRSDGRYHVDIESALSAPGE